MSLCWTVRLSFLLWFRWCAPTACRYAERRGLQRVGGKSSSHCFFERLVFPGVPLPSLPLLPPAAPGREESLLRRPPNLLPLCYIWPPLHHSALDHWIKCKFLFCASKLSSCPVLIVFLCHAVCTSFFYFVYYNLGSYLRLIVRACFTSSDEKSHSQFAYYF